MPSQAFMHERQLVTLHQEALLSASLMHAFRISLCVCVKGKELLNPGRLGAHTPEKRVRMALTSRGQAVLSTDLNVQGEPHT